MLYSSSTLSLACLEILVHVKQPRLPNDYAYARFDLPEELVLTLGAADVDNEEVCAEVGTRWIEAGNQPALRVPSVIIPNRVQYPVQPPTSGLQTGIRVRTVGLLV